MFEQPPLVEQAITVVFEPIEQFSIGDFGAFWQVIRAGFPSCEAKPLVERVIETFEGFAPAEAQFRLVPHEVLPRCMFRSHDGGELLQLQPDRLTFNWSHAGGGQYPHFEATVGRFRELFALFAEYVAAQGWPPIVPSQCEVSNINIVPVEQIGTDFTDTAKAFVMPAIAATSALLELETTTVATQFRVMGNDGKPAGRLHNVLMPVRRVHDEQLAIRFELTARSAPLSSIAEFESFLPIARSAINTAFLNGTTEWAHSLWGYDHGASA